MTQFAVDDTMGLVYDRTGSKLRKATPMKTVRLVLYTLLAALLGFANVGASQTPPKQGDSVKSQIRALGTDRLVEVRLSSGPRLRGWIGAISESGFELRLGKEKLERQSLGFDQIRSIKPVDVLKPSHTARNILIGVGITIGVLLGLAAAFAPD